MVTYIAYTLTIGISEALEKQITRYVIPPPVSQRRLDFEHKRPRLYALGIGS